MSNLNENLKPLAKLNPFGRFCVTIGHLPASYMESLSYEEQLIWFCNFLEKTVIPAINNNAEATEEVQNLFIELKNYVENYFEDLDVQEEINQKLDDMAEHGELTEIIAQYLQLQGLLCFNTIADLKEAENIVDGSFVKTYGKLQYNDGDGAFYKIRDVTNEDDIDEINIIKINTSDTLIAEKISSNLINSKVSKEKIGFAQDNDYYIGLGVGLFVDAINGNDENDGMTQNTACKTIKGLFDKHVKSGNMNINVYLKSGSIYDFPYWNILDMTIHFVNYGGTDPATINFSGGYMAFYNCHLNFGGTETNPLIITGNNFYMDGGTFVYKYTDIKTEFSCIGGAGSFANSKMNYGLKLNSGNYYLENCEIGTLMSITSLLTFATCTFLTNNVPNEQNYCLSLINCIAYVLGVTYVDMTNAKTDGYFLLLNGGQLSQNAVFTARNVIDNKKFLYGVDLNDASYIITNSRLTQLSQIGATGYNKRNGSSISEET